MGKKPRIPNAGSFQPGHNRGGAPSIYTQELADKICKSLASGMSLRRILKEDGMPQVSTVLNWALDSKHPFYSQYANARRVQAELYIDEVSDISDDSTNDYILTEKGMVTNIENIQRARLRVDTRKWIACKVLPKIYGDKIQNEHSGSISLEQLVSGSTESKE